MKDLSLHGALFGGALMVAIVSTLAFGKPGQAQDGSHAHVQEARDVGEYAGVRPGSSNTPPRAEAAQRSPATIVTWPGFEPTGGGRFFVQTTSPVSTEVIQEEGKVIVVLKNVRSHLRNTRRWLHTRFFNTPVLRARVERRGRNDLAFVFQMRTPATPQVTTSAGANGFQFVFVDFPAGNYATPITQ